MAQQMANGAQPNPKPAAPAPAPASSGSSSSSSAGGPGQGPTAQQVVDNTNALNANAAATTAAQPTPAEQQTTALETFQSMLSGLPPNLINSLTTIATPYISTTTPPQQVMLDIQQSAPFKAMFPGIQKAIDNGIPPPSISDYLNYQQYAYQLADAAGIPRSFMEGEIGDLIGNGVSQSDLETRVTQGYTAAMQSDPQTRAYLEANFGVGPGGLAAFYLNPEAASSVLTQETTASQIAGAGENAGFAPISVSRSMQLAQLGVSQNAAVGGFKQAAELLPLTDRYGMAKAGPAQVSQDTLVGAEFVGDRTSQRAVQLAQETRTAATRGGGGYSPEQHGTGAGYGSQAGFSQ